MDSDLVEYEVRYLFDDGMREGTQRAESHA
jgi:hypothetical protein